MFFRTLAPLIAITVALAGCSGGGGSPSTSTLPTSTTQNATGTLTIGTPTSGTASNARKPAYVSPSTTFATLWIDAGAGDRVPCSPDSLTSGQCTINWTSTSGTHNFTVEVDDSSSISGGGYVLGDINQSETLTPGSNALSNITLGAVAAQVTFVSEVSYATNSPNCLDYGNQNCILASSAVEDADGNTIVPPGNFDEPVCMSVSNNSIAFLGDECPSAIQTSGQMSTLINCLQGATGTFTVSGDSGVTDEILTTTQLTAYSLRYPNQSPYEISNWPTYSCSNGAVNAVGPANGSVTVQAAPKTP